jgi:LysM repeat protein
MTPTPAPTLGPSPEPTLAPLSTVAPAETPAVQPPEAPPTAGPTASGETESSSETIHVVQPGENLYRIGLLYGLSWVAIAEYNGIADPNAITAGQEIRIPPAATPEADDQNTTTAGQQTAGSLSTVVAVGPGDTLYSIAKAFGIGWDLIAEANGLGAPNHIHAGQVLKIPADLPGTAPDFLHYVHGGETLAGIARQYGLLPDALAEANHLAAPYVIYPGQELIIPGDE